MQYFWLLDGKTQKYLKFYYQPGQENLGNCPSKHHTADIKIEVTPTHREGDNESKPRWSISTHNNENEPVTLDLTLNDLQPDFLETELFESGF